MPTLAVSATMLGALALPLLFAALARERALRGRDEVEARWFSFARRIHAVIQLAPAAWLITAMWAVPQTPFLFTFLRDSHPGAAVVVFLGVLTPTALLPALLGLIANAVARRLGTTEITWNETLRRGAWLVAAAVVPAVPLGLGAAAVVRAEWLAGGAGFVVAGAIGLFCLMRSRKGLGLTPHSVTHGPLRDRLFALAGRAGVKLQQLYVLPMRRMRMANAFAVNGQMVMVTDLLLDRLDRDEVDAILAHEIAHLKRGDPLKLALANLGAGVVPVLALQSFGWGWVALGLCLGFLAATAYSRRIERATDREALRLGANGASFISGLAKVARLSHVPIRWSRWTGWWVTHPSVAARAIAVGREAGMGGNEIDRLLGSPVGSADHYAVPAGLEHGGRLFSTPFKHATLARNMFILLFLAVLVPAATFSLARMLGAGPDLRVANTLIALLLGPLACLAVLDFIAVQPLHGLRRRLARRLGLGDDPETRDWQFAGLSPHAGPRVYEGFSNWELGFVRAGGDALEFLGEEVSFSLPADRMVEVIVTGGAPTWIPTRSVRVDWLDDAGDEHSLRLTPLNGAGLHSIGPRADRLGGAIDAWRSRPPVARSPTVLREDDASSAAPGTLAPHALAARLALPPSGCVTSSHPRALARLGNLIPFAVLDTLIAVGLCGMLGLPILPFGGPGAFETVFLALATQLFLLVPALRYRDPVIEEKAGHEQRRRGAA